MKKRFFAMICILLFVVTFTAQAVRPDLEEDGGKVGDEIGLFTPDFMIQYANVSPNETIWAYDIEVSKGVSYAYMTDYKLYTSKEIDANIRVLCELTPHPEDWYKHEEDGTITEEEIEQLGNVVTDIVTYDGKVYGFSSYSGNFGLIDGQGPHWNEVKLDVSSMRAGDSEIRCRSVMRSFLSDDNQ